MKKEIFKKDNCLTLFDSDRFLIESGDYYELTNIMGYFPHLTLKDTAMHPEGWTSARINISFIRFDENAQLHLALGKPYSNNKISDARTTIIISRTRVDIKTPSASVSGECDLKDSDIVKISVSDGILNVCNVTAPICADEINGYMEMFGDGGSIYMTEVCADSDIEPYTEEKHNEVLLKWRHDSLDEADRKLDALEAYLKENPLPQKKGDIILPERLIDINTEMTVKVISYGSKNAALVITHDSFGENPVTQTCCLDFVQDGDNYIAEVNINFNIAGNTRFELWANHDCIVRQVAVLDKGYMAVIPWVGSTTPLLDEDLHKHDLPGDYWMDCPAITDAPEAQIKKFYKFIENYRKYGDRIACVVNARELVPCSETGSLFELDTESQRRGLEQICRQMKLMGFDSTELIASYTPDGVSIDIMEELGIKGLTSLCAWQNCQDGGWKINHWAVSNQPYYPADDDFRRAGQKQRGIMCFTMANSSCNRNYSLMALDGCPTNVAPGERYFDKRVVHHHVQRFFDAFDGYIADAAHTDGLLTVTAALESFCGHMDWAAANDMAIRYMVSKARTEKIVFTSAADVSEYHTKRNLPLQSAYFFQPDYYYGYHNGELPGRVDDRIEADTPEYIAVIRKSSSIPMYFYDYSAEWGNAPYDDIKRNLFGLVNPDTQDSTKCSPPQVNTKDIKIDYKFNENILTISIESETDKKKMVTGVFDVPFKKDFTFTVDKTDTVIKKITDRWENNTHLFIDLGKIKAGKQTVTIEISGTPHTPSNSEFIKNGFGVMYFNDHAYMRAVDMHEALKIEMNAPDGAYILPQSGKRVHAKDGKLEFTVNTDWSDEAPLLYGYPKQEFEANIKTAKITVTGKSKSRRWSWENVYEKYE